MFWVTLPFLFSERPIGPHEEAVADTRSREGAEWHRRARYDPGGGFLLGGLYIDPGRAGAGKTILANQICFHHVR